MASGPAVVFDDEEMEMDEPSSGSASASSTALDLSFEELRIQSEEFRLHEGLSILSYKVFLFSCSLFTPEQKRNPYLFSQWTRVRFTRLMSIVIFVPGSPHHKVAVRLLSQHVVSIDIFFAI